MVWLTVVLLLALIASVFLKQLPIAGHWPVESRRPLTPVEQKLYWRLAQALPGYPILAQVQLSRMMTVKRVPKAQTWRNRLTQKSADFVVCNKDFSVAVVIELDDSTHAREDRRKADIDKDAALIAAGIPIIRWSVKNLPDVATIQHEVHASISHAPASQASASAQE